MQHQALFRPNRARSAGNVPTKMSLRATFGSRTALGAVDYTVLNCLSSENSDSFVAELIWHNVLADPLLFSCFVQQLTKWRVLLKATPCGVSVHVQKWWIMWQMTQRTVKIIVVKVQTWCCFKSHIYQHHIFWPHIRLVLDLKSWAQSHLCHFVNESNNSIQFYEGLCVVLS